MGVLSRAFVSLLEGPFEGLGLYLILWCSIKEGFDYELLFYQKGKGLLKDS